MKKHHTFHIPVMGTGFSIDTPLKVAKYGISSVVSLVDDTLIEEMRKFHAQKAGEPYVPITKQEDDYRARRITAYLNLLDKLVHKQFEELKATSFEIGSEITKYFEMLPNTSPLKKLYQAMLRTNDREKKSALQTELRESMRMGDINVNIMTKLDRPNYDSKGSTLLPPEYSDALAALRGYAKSRLDSAIVFSAGINQRLYSYAAEFKDFYADATGRIKKRIILKVSDYRSSIIQGKFFAKKGLWVSEYRVESGLNCGGHAFASQGNLLGPILEEFKNRRKDLVASLHTIYTHALRLKNRLTFPAPHPIRVTAQGGIGTAMEDKFLRDHYELDATGWGSPFLLCPEATNLDEETLKKLSQAGEEDLYLSEVSPLGVPFNNLRGNNSDTEKERRAEIGRPGSACPKGHLVSNTEFDDKPICTASRLYQKLKIDQLNAANLPPEEYREALRRVTIKACICNDLGEGVLIKNKVMKNGKRFSAVCPGPNLAYFSRIVSLQEMADHIYGRLSILNATYRPNMFIKELKIYIDYFVREVKKLGARPDAKETLYWDTFRANMMDGIEYYRKLFPKMLSETAEYRRKMLLDLDQLQRQLEEFVAGNRFIFPARFEGAMA